MAIFRIEHLYPDELERFVQNVFGFMRPKVVILTTPNKEFNARLQDLENKFRFLTNVILRLIYSTRSKRFILDTMTINSNGPAWNLKGGAKKLFKSFQAMKCPILEWENLQMTILKLGIVLRVPFL